MEKDNDIIKLDLMDYLSGGNHELFHSNLLAYIGKIDPEGFLNLLDVDVKSFSSLNDFNSENLRREYKNFDISITGDNDQILLVVENKMKSFPNKKQLEKYEDRINKINKNNVNCCYRLLSLIDVNDTSEFDPWGIMTYEKLAENLRKTYLEEGKDRRDLIPSLPQREREYFMKFLEDYVVYIRKLYEILDPKNLADEIKNNKFTCLCFNPDKDKNNKWLHLFQRKLLFEALKNLIEEKVKERIKTEKSPSYLNFNAGVTRATPYAEITIGFDNSGKLVNNPTISEATNELFYWIQIYQSEVQRGFTFKLNDALSEEIQSSKNKKTKKKGSEKEINSAPEIQPGECTENEEPKKFDRQGFIKRVWQGCESNPHYKKIASKVYTKNFSFNNFIPVPERKRKLRAYLYRDLAMVFVPEIIKEEKDISVFVNEISEEIVEIIKLLKEPERYEDTN